MNATSLAQVGAPAAAMQDGVWVVDDDRSIRWVLEKALARDGIPHRMISSVYEVRQALAMATPGVLVCDVRMPGESGLTLLGELLERDPGVPIILITAYSHLDCSVVEFRRGAF
jgi:two-component system nitrogen regulation response regulator GlnG